MISIATKLKWYKFVLNKIRLQLMAGIRTKEKKKIEKIKKQYDIMHYLKNNCDSKEKEKILIWLMNNEIKTFPYQFPDNYCEMEVNIQFDEYTRHKYVIYHGRKMYMKKGMTDNEIINYVRSISMEQDIESPHRYEYEIADVSGKYIADIGGAEGFFALDVIEYAAHVFIFECDPGWLEALALTFQPYDNKTIVPLMVGDKTNEKSTTLDDYFENKQIDIIKADIEGYEVPMIENGLSTLKKIKKVILCTYHKADAERRLREILQKYNFNTYTSSGYMFFHMYDSKPMPPYFRRALLYGERCDKN